MEFVKLNFKIPSNFKKDWYDIPNALSFVFGDAPIDISRRVRHYWNSFVTIHPSMYI